MKRGENARMQENEAGRVVVLIRLRTESRSLAIRRDDMASRTHPPPTAPTSPPQTVTAYHFTFKHLFFWNKSS